MQRPLARPAGGALSCKHGKVKVYSAHFTSFDISLIHLPNLGLVKALAGPWTAITLPLSRHGPFRDLLQRSQDDQLQGGRGSAAGAGRSRPTAAKHGE